MEQLIEVLIENYGFEVNGETPQTIATDWLERYEASWIRLAIIEALYLGRYKAISVEQILNLWCRRGQPKFHFTHEFEQLICHRLPKALREFSVAVEDERKISSSRSKPESKPQSKPEDEKPTELPLSINRFTPLFDHSQVYSKLKAVAHSETN